jgi:hypothetical protein
LVGLLTPCLLRAQVTVDTTKRDTSRVVPPLATTSQVPDSLKPPVSPGKAFLNSFLVPGLGQSRLDRQVPGAIFVAIEVMSIVMLAKTHNDLRIAKAQSADAIVSRYLVDPVTGGPVLDDNGQLVPLDTVPDRFSEDRVEARRSQIEDWVAVLVFNHLISGADAFVASLLWDLPARVGMRHLPRGIGVGLSVRW